VKYCPRTIALKAGEVVYDGPSCELTPELLNSIYGAESSDLFLPALDQPRISVRGPEGMGSGTSIRHPAPQRLQQVSTAAV
jgi:ABC-type cobalamin/Fe3+-siderophores transport system ATPase subunit